MGARLRLPLGLVLNQAPQQGGGHVRRTVSGGGASARAELVARASVYGHAGSAEKGFHCRRGETITLDSTGSSRQALVFEWTLVADAVPVARAGRYYTPENPPAPARFETKRTGKSIKVFALADFTATLVVKDGSSASPPQSIDVFVQPREWTTRYVQHREVKYFAKYFGTNAYERHSGSNECTECGPKIKDKHWIHRRGDRTDWKEQFRIARVNDPGGLFHELWYVAKLDLHIDRTLYVNSELTTGQVHQLNHAAGVVQDFRDNLKARVDATTLHEELHGNLVEEALGEEGNDPAPWVELLIGEDQAALAEQANSEIARKEAVLSDATAGPIGHERLRGRLRAKLAKTKVTFLLPSSESDKTGAEYPTDLLEFDDV